VAVPAGHDAVCGELGNKARHEVPLTRPLHRVKGGVLGVKLRRDVPCVLGQIGAVGMAEIAYLDRPLGPEPLPMSRMRPGAYPRAPFVGLSSSERCAWWQS
jgi:hypothetical protein